MSIFGPPSPRIGSGGPVCGEDHTTKAYVDSSDAATKKYVDSRKPLVTVWAEENMATRSGAYQWSFGGGATGASQHGYPMMVAGRILRMGLTAVRENGGPPGRVVTVNIVVNGIVRMAYGVTKPGGQYVGTTAFGTPLDISQGDTINFRSTSTNSSVGGAVVSLLIELDL